HCLIDSVVGSLSRLSRVQRLAERRRESRGSAERTGVQEIAAPRSTTRRSVSRRAPRLEANISHAHGVGDSGAPIVQTEGGEALPRHACSCRGYPPARKTWRK